MSMMGLQLTQEIQWGRIKAADCILINPPLTTHFCYLKFTGSGLLHLTNEGHQRLQGRRRDTSALPVAVVAFFCSSRLTPGLLHHPPFFPVGRVEHLLFHSFALTFFKMNGSNLLFTKRASWSCSLPCSFKKEQQGASGYLALYCTIRATGI